jgi:micrococcal nuclease
MNKYVYSARVTKIYDGDTITVDIDLGLGVWVKKQKLRLARINAPELRGPGSLAGVVARNYLRKVLTSATVDIRTIKDRKGKYGRYIAEVMFNGTNISDDMVANGHAKYRNY